MHVLARGDGLEVVRSDATALETRVVNLVALRDLSESREAMQRLIAEEYAMSDADRADRLVEAWLASKRVA